MVRPQRLDKLAALAEDILRFVELAEGVLERLKVRAGNLTVPEYLGHVRRIPLSDSHIYIQLLSARFLAVQLFLTEVLRRHAR